MAYVYRHIRLDKNEPFYIGIAEDDGGKYRRAYDGIERRKNSKIWGFIANKTDYEVEIMLDEIEWSDACKKEMEFIELYGRIDNKTGILANMTNGGEGVKGRVLTEEQRYKYGNSNRGKKQSEIANQKRRQAMVGFKHSKESLIKMSLKQKGKIISESSRQKIRESLIGKPNLKARGKKRTEETRKKMSERMMGHSPSEETRKKIGEFHKGKKWSLGRKWSEEYKKHKKEITKTKKPVLQYSLNGCLIAEYLSQREAAQITGIAKEAIGRACRGVKGYKNHICKGFIWKHKNIINE